MKKFLFGIDRRKLIRYRILYTNAQTVGIIPEKQEKEVFKLAMSLAFQKVLAAAVLMPSVYFLQLPLETLVAVPVKFFFFSLSYRAFTYRGREKVLEKIGEVCEEFQLDEKVDELKLSEEERGLLELYKDYK